MFCCFTTRLVRAFDDDGEVDEGVGCDRRETRGEPSRAPTAHATRTSQCDDHALFICPSLGEPRVTPPLSPAAHTLCMPLCSRLLPTAWPAVGSWGATTARRFHRSSPPTPNHLWA